MTITPPNNTRNFKPIKIGDSLNKVNQKLLYKFGKLDYIIHAKWAEIVGNFFVNYTEPQKISSIPLVTNDSYDTIYVKYLHVNVTPSAAVEFQQFQNKIVEKINTYFGYKAIRGIKIHQTLINKDKIKTKKNKINFSEIKKNIEEIKKTTPKLNNKDLEQSIVNLGLSISKENK